MQNFAEGSDETVWVTGLVSGREAIGRSLVLASGANVRLRAAGWRLLHDRRGHLWVAALGGGLLRVRSSDSKGVIERFSYESKISGSPRSLFQDRDNNVWVGMRGGGLLRLSEGLVNDDVVLEGLTNDGVRALSVASDGSVWVATGHNLNRFDRRDRAVYSLPQTLSLYNDKTGRMWAATAHGIGEIQNGAFRPLATSPQVRWERISSLIADTNGDLWMCSIDQGLLWWRNGALTQPDETPDLSMRPCNFVCADRRGRVWIGFSAGGVGVQDSVAFTPARRPMVLASGGIGAIFEDRTDAIWIATSSRISRFHNGRFTTLTAANGPFEDIVPSIVDDDGESGSASTPFGPRALQPSGRWTKSPSTGRIRSVFVGRHLRRPAGRSPLVEPSGGCPCRRRPAVVRDWRGCRDCRSSKSSTKPAACDSAHRDGVGGRPDAGARRRAGAPRTSTLRISTALSLSAASVEVPIFAHGSQQRLGSGRDAPGSVL